MRSSVRYDGDVGECPRPTEERSTWGDERARPRPETTSLLLFGSYHYSAAGGVVCPGCGQAPSAFCRFDAITMVRQVGWRGQDVLRHPDDLLSRHAPRGPWLTVLELAAGAADVLGQAGGAVASGPPTVVSLAPASCALTRASVRATLVEHTAALVAAIEGAGAQEWERARPAGAVRPSEVVWLALHDATHRLEDAELAVRGALTRHSSL